MAEHAGCVMPRGALDLAPQQGDKLGTGHCAAGVRGAKSARLFGIGRTALAPGKADDCLMCV